MLLLDIKCDKIKSPYKKAVIVSPRGGVQYWKSVDTPNEHINHICLDSLLFEQSYQRFLLVVIVIPFAVCFYCCIFFFPFVPLFFCHTRA